MGALMVLVTSLGGYRYLHPPVPPVSPPEPIEMRAEEGSISLEHHKRLAAQLKAKVASNVMHLDHLQTLSQYARPLVVAIEQVDPKLFTAGSGFLYQDRFIVTNHHVIGGLAPDKDGAIQFRLLDGRSGRAKIIGADKMIDVAVLELNPRDFDLEAIPSAEITREPVRAGESIIAVGNPFGQFGWSTTTGVVSSINRHESNIPLDYLQTDAAINPGNSGGPTFNMAGDVVAMNTIRMDGAEGIALSIESQTLQRVVDKIIREHAQKAPK
jgi:S1-C subfamily serine protease